MASHHSALGTNIIMTPHSLASHHTPGCGPAHIAHGLHGITARDVTLKPFLQGLHGTCMGLALKTKRHPVPVFPTVQRPSPHPRSQSKNSLPHQCHYRQFSPSADPPPPHLHPSLTAAFQTRVSLCSSLLSSDRTPALQQLFFHPPLPSYKGCTPFPSPLHPTVMVMQTCPPLSTLLPPSPLPFLPHPPVS